MGRIVIRILFIISISLNLALIGNWLFSRSSSPDLTVPLNLTGDQQKQLVQTRTNLHQQNEKVKEKIRSCQQKLLIALNEEPVDKSKVNVWIEEISVLQKEMQKNSIDGLLQMRTYLEPDQCNCLLEGVGAEMERVSKPCNKSCCNPKN